VMFSNLDIGRRALVRGRREQCNERIDLVLGAWLRVCEVKVHGENRPCDSQLYRRQLWSLRHRECERERDCTRKVGIATLMSP